MTHITLSTKPAHSGIQLKLAAAPQEISPATVGKEVGEIRFNPTDQTATVSVGSPAKLNLEMSSTRGPSCSTRRSATE